MLKSFGRCCLGYWHETFAKPENNLYRNILKVTIGNCQYWSPGAQDRFLRRRCQSQGVVAGCVSIEPILPEIGQTVAAMNTAQGQDVLGLRLAPKHPGLLATASDQRFAAGFNDARSDEKASAAERAVA
jgi:hypothetical protein